MNERRQPPLRRVTLTRNNPERLENEQRESPRFRVSASVRFLRAATDGPKVIDGDALKVSLRGMRVVLNQPIHKNEQLLVATTGLIATPCC